MTDLVSTLMALCVVGTAFALVAIIEFAAVYPYRRARRRVEQDLARLK
jgi:hypothetical protein